MRTHFVCLTVALVFGPLAAAQSVDDTQLKQVIIFGRHAIRTPILPNAALDMFAASLYPSFSTPPAPALGLSVITPAGTANETNLGAYFRLWLTQQGVLTGNDAADAGNAYFRANGEPLITDTAAAFVAGLFPSVASTITINAYPTTENDPLFNTVAAGVAVLDYQKAVAAVNGRLGSNPQAISTAYAPELALTQSVLFGNPPNVAAGKTDPTSIPIGTSAGNSTLPVTIAGLSDVIYAIDPFLMEYTDGLPLAEVGWGQLGVGSINQIDRLYDLLLDLEFRTPYLDRVQSSNLASHLVRTMVQAATGTTTPGALPTPPATKLVVLTASNTNITGLAGLFQMDWLLPGYERNVAALGGALVFELRQSQSSGEFIVRVSYVSQTMDQLRKQTQLTLSEPPASAPVFIPNCSMDNATFDCPLSGLVKIANQVIDPHSADLVN